MMESNLDLQALRSGRRFRLVRYFTITSLVVIALVALVLGFFLQRQRSLLQEMQQQESGFFASSQDKLAKQRDKAAVDDLLTVHEAGNVNLTKLFANALWDNDFAPLVQKVQDIPVADCQAMADVVDPKTQKSKPSPEKAACFSEVGSQIRAIGGFDRLHRKVYDSMKNTTVFKIKVFDLRGITVYSSELAQVGEDKSNNAGWKGAAKDGIPKSELTHRAKFSAFEGVVEDRDLISSYLPVVAPGTSQIVGVFEVYSDVTPFLAQIKRTSDLVGAANRANATELNQIADTNEGVIARSSTLSILLTVSLLLVLFGALFMIVRRADRIIQAQESEREHAQQNLAQSEKMASLGQMVAGVAHQLNTPIAFSSNNVAMVVDALQSYEEPLKVATRFADLVGSVQGDRVTLDIAAAKAKLHQVRGVDADVSMPIEMLNDTLNGLEQMRELVENLRNFTRLDRSKTAHVDLNQGIKTVAYMAKSVMPSHVMLEEQYGPLSEIQCNVSQLNQVFLNLINNAVQAIPAGESGQVTVKTCMENNQVTVRVSDTGTGIPPQVLPHIFDNYFTTKKEGEGTGLGLPIAKSIVEEHGGTIEVETAQGKGTTFTVRLPLQSPAESVHA